MVFIHVRLACAQAQSIELSLRNASRDHVDIGRVDQQLESVDELGKLTVVRMMFFEYKNPIVGHCQPVSELLEGR